MRKTMYMVLYFIIVAFSFGCNENAQEVRIMKYSAYFSSNLEQDVEYDKRDVVKILSDEITKEKTANFYVLAPQDYRKEKGAGKEITLRKAVVDEGDNLKPVSVISERFAVCNEQKYGAQITDWGQLGGIAMNFQIVITIDMDYVKAIRDLKFDYVEVVDNVISVGTKAIF